MILTGDADNNTLTGGSENDEIYGLGGNDTLSSDDGNDLLDGGTGNDLLDGGTGNDAMIGGAGEDTYYVDSTSDTVIETASVDIDEVIASVTYIMAGSHGDNVENLTLLEGFDHIGGTGNGLDNILTGNSSDNILDGGLGVDTMIGGLGDDTFIVNTTGETVTEEDNAGTDLVKSAISYDLAWAANVENLTLTGVADINATGTELDNILIGNGQTANDGFNILNGLGGNDTLKGGFGKDTLNGGEGDDTMEGGKQDDIYFVDAVGDVVTEVIGEGVEDLVMSTITYTLTDNVENLILIGMEDINGTGNTLNNIIAGNTGINTLVGGIGDDIYLFRDTSEDTVVELLAGGTNDYIVNDSRNNYTLTDNVEHLILFGGENLSGTGNILANHIYGNGGVNSLSGFAGNDLINGGAEDDFLYGGDGNDIFDDSIVTSSSTFKNREDPNNIYDRTSGYIHYAGYATGADRMEGGAGNDIYYVDDFGDDVIEAALPADRSDEVKSIISYMLSANVENLTLLNHPGHPTTGDDINGTGNDQDNILTGNGFVNILWGLGGNDTLNGGLGVDDLRGGAGNDIYVMDGSGDTVKEELNEGTDTVQSTVTYTLLANVENLTLGAGTIDGTGNELANVLTGGTGNNTLDGRAGIDIMRGDIGNDIYYVDVAEDTVQENSGAGTDEVRSLISYSLLDDTTNVENLTLIGIADIDGTGNTGNNVLIGNSSVNTLTGGAGNDTLDGGAGNDTLIGGLGDDNYIVDAVGDVVQESTVANEGTDTVKSGVSYTLSTNVENLTLTGTVGNSGTGNADNNILTGNSGNNTLSGGAGNDTLDGGLGNDTLSGGQGDDLYIVDAVGDVVQEGSGAGTDTVKSSGSYTLSGDAANVENLILTGTLDIDGTGNALDNILTGNSGANILSGLAGNDTLDGGAGNDTLDSGEGNDILTGGTGDDTMVGGTGNDIYYVDALNDKVQENITTNEGTDLVNSSVAFDLSGTAAFVENLTFSGSGAFTGNGNALNNSLKGNTGANILYGWAGDDTLDGGTGGDVLIGGSGDDIYFVDNLGDSIRDYAGEGNDTVNSSVTYELSGDAADVENLTLTGTSAINGTGNAGNNILTGNTGKNTLTGGAGDDTYYVNLATDVVVENPGEGTDLVYATSTTVNTLFTLAANVENLTLTGTTAINGTGNELDNILIGNDGKNILDGKLGNDDMSGGLGDDTYNVDADGDTVTEAAGTGSGTDLVISNITYNLSSQAVNVENLTLAVGVLDIDGTGSSANNILTGNAGKNTLNGLGGIDTMIGGLGDDTYYVDVAGDVITEVATGGTADQVYSSATGYTLGINVENLTLTGTGDSSGTGNASANRLIGNIAANTLIGLAGNDTYVISDYSDTIVEIASASGGIADTVESSVSYGLSGDAAYIENLILTGSANINGTGNDFSNVLTGNAGINTLDGMGGNDTLNGEAGDDVLNGGAGLDILDGGLGADVMAGGDGNDTYYVDAGDSLTENANTGAGTDLVYSSAATFTLMTNVENLTLRAGFGDIRGYGNAVDNILIGNEGINILDGGAGKDSLKGGAGSDTLYGGIGNDTLDGEAGSDLMDGGAGDDSYAIDAQSDVVFENGAEGTDTVTILISDALDDNVENLILGGNSAIDGTGNSLDNRLTGNSAANTLNGLGGNDIYVISADNDTVTEGAGQGTDLVESSISYSLTANVENLTLSGVAISGTGNILANLLTGNSKDNILDGLTGNDTMLGLGGNDSYSVDAAGDTVTESLNQGTDRVYSSAASYTLGANVEELLLMGAALSGSGNGSGNILTGNGLANVLNGLAGNDVLNGGDGNDSLIGGDGDDALNGQAGNDTMRGGAGNDTYFFDGADTVVELANEGDADEIKSAVTCNFATVLNVENLTLTGALAINGTGNSMNNLLIGNTASNILNGGAGNDTLNGMGGIDTMIGGIGDDTYYVDVAGEVITEGTAAGVDTIYSGISYSLASLINVENLILKDTAQNGTGNNLDNVLTGNDVANTLTGNAGNDTLDGLGGADFMVGGLGNDTYYVRDISDVVTEGVAAGTDLIYSTLTSYSLAANVEKIIFLSNSGVTAIGNALDNELVGTKYADTLNGLAGNDTLKGLLGNDTLDGGEGNDILDGGGGSDTLRGGLGNDTYYVDASGDKVTENVNEGTDLVNSSVTFTIGLNVENLTLIGTNPISGTGNTLNNGLTGNTGNNTLTGLAGNDSLNGGTGNDSLFGGTGNDIYYVDVINDRVYETTTTVSTIDTGGVDTVISSATSWTLGSYVENLTLGGTAAINGTGNTLNNILIGNTGANILNGGGGSDMLRGGFGNDTYYVDASGDKVTENVNEGTDLVNSSVTFTIGLNVENLTLIGTNPISGTGNTLNNGLTGNTGNNTLTGLAGDDSLNGGTGNDSLFGGAGNDIYYVDVINDRVYETTTTVSTIDTGGVDTVISSATSWTLGSYVENLTLGGAAAINGTGNTLNNNLIGNTGANILNGSSGNDILNGGLGKDTLVGGLGADSFVFDSVLNATLNTDSITDFASVDDTIRLDQSIFTKLSIGPSLNATQFRFSAAVTAADSNDYILYNTTSGALLYDADGNGVGVAIQFATLTAHPAITAADFIVVA